MQSHSTRLPFLWQLEHLTCLRGFHRDPVRECLIFSNVYLLSNLGAALNDVWPTFWTGQVGEAVCLRGTYFAICY